MDAGIHVQIKGLELTPYVYTQLHIMIWSGDYNSQILLYASAVMTGVSRKLEALWSRRCLGRSMLLYEEGRPRRRT
jgi:hypothetical protein